MEMLDEAIAMARRIEDSRALIEALRTHLSPDRDPARIGDRVRLIGEILDIAQNIDDKYLQMELLAFRVYDPVAVADTDGWARHPACSDNWRRHGRWEDAESHFEHALDLNARMSAATWLAHTKFHYNRMLFQRDEAKDVEHANGLLDSALQTAIDLGMRGLESRIKASAGDG